MKRVAVEEDCSHAVRTVSDIGGCQRGDTVEQIRMSGDRVGNLHKVNFVKGCVSLRQPGRRELKQLDLSRSVR